MTVIILIRWVRVHQSKISILVKSVVWSALLFSDEWILMGGPSFVHCQLCKTSEEKTKCLVRRMSWGRSVFFLSTKILEFSSTDFPTEKWAQFWRTALIFHISIWHGKIFNYRHAWPEIASAKSWIGINSGHAALPTGASGFDEMERERAGRRGGGGVVWWEVPEPACCLFTRSPADIHPKCPNSLHHPNICRTNCVYSLADVLQKGIWSLFFPPTFSTTEWPMSSHQPQMWSDTTTLQKFRFRKCVDLLFWLTALHQKKKKKNSYSSISIWRTPLPLFYIKKSPSCKCVHNIVIPIHKTHR